MVMFIYSFVITQELHVDTVNFFFHLIYCFFLVPFRDSVLTKLLKNALGGNSKTFMVTLCYSEFVL